MIAVKERGKDLPQKEHLRNGAEKNKDGMGIGWWKHGFNKVKVKKDFNNFEELWKFIEDNIAKDDVLVVHFRTSTGGKKDNGGSHPYPVTSNRAFIRKEIFESNLIVAHNGIISDYDRNEVFSDTQQFILDILSKPIIKDNIGNNDIIKLIQMAVDPGRLVFLDKDGLLILIGNWENEEGIYFSNTQYKTAKYSILRYGAEDYYDNAYYGSYFGKGKFNTRVKTYEEVCDGCNSEKDVIRMKFGKRYLSLCKNCRRLMSQKTNRPVKLELLRLGYYSYEIERMRDDTKKYIIDNGIRSDDISINQKGKIFLVNDTKKRIGDRCLLCGKHIGKNDTKVIDGEKLCENCALVFSTERY